MNLSDALDAHRRWKDRLRRYLELGAAPDALTVERDDACPLGVWLQGEGRPYTRTEPYTDLVEVHAAFHVAAANVVKRAQSGNPQAALADLERGAYAEASARLERRLTALRDAVAAGRLSKA